MEHQGGRFTVLTHGSTGLVIRGVESGFFFLTVAVFEEEAAV